MTATLLLRSCFRLPGGEPLYPYRPPPAMDEVRSARLRKLSDQLNPSPPVLEEEVSIKVFHNKGVIMAASGVVFKRKVLGITKTNLDLWRFGSRSTQTLAVLLLGRQVVHHAQQ